MIKKEHRLTKNKHFQFIYRRGKTSHSKYLTLVFVPTKIKPFKVGFSVSKKIGKSTVRNKVKRRMRECFNLLEKNFNSGFNYIYVAKKGIEEIDFWAIKKEMEYVLKKAGLFLFK
jgi:ribonuclease P protein component